jgi:hypothetical protein
MKIKKVGKEMKKYFYRSEIGLEPIEYDELEG